MTKTPLFIITFSNIVSPEKVSIRNSHSEKKEVKQADKLKI